MSFRLLLAASLVPVAFATTAAAQTAPGACAECVVIAPAPAPSAADLSRRIGVGLHLSSFAVKSADAPEDAEPRHLGGGGLDIKYRLTPRWELALGLETLHEHDDDGEPVGDELHSVTLGAAYHFRPTRRWNWYLAAAVGGIHESDRDEEGRGQFQLGIGLERRFRRFSIGAELRAVGIAPAENDEIQAASRTSGVAPPPPVEDDDDRRGDGGARFSIGATYYF